jgi:ubiquinone/menaquinone biosynthesis C-methylase UbiE
MMRAGDRKFYALLQRQSNVLHSPAYAQAYRASDERGKTDESHTLKYNIISELSHSFGHAPTVLDLGCGTGRYFHCMQNAKCLVGVDASWPMLEQAKVPVYGGAQQVHLMHSTVHEVEFRPAVFDLVICVGVFGLVCPLDDYVLQKLSRFTRPDGVVFLTIPEYNPTPSTWKRKAAKALEPLLFGAAKRYVNVKLGEFQMPEDTLRTLVRHYFPQVHISRWVSPTRRVDLHCVARRQQPL